jgi:xylulokinase
VGNFVTAAHAKNLLLAIDVGTGSVRAALVNLRGRIVAFSAREHEQIVPAFGWAEQRPADWWEGAVASIRAVLGEVDHAAHRVLAVAACGQMHGTVLLDDSGALVVDSVQLWNDKRGAAEVAAFAAANDVDVLWPVTANPPAVAWPGFKLQWIQRHQPDAFARARTLLMPKDYINFRLTGEPAMDQSDASCSYLFDARSNDWSPLLADRMGIDPGLLPPVHCAEHRLGSVTPAAAQATGLLTGTPVACGTSDFAATLLGSGVSPAHRGSDITGTSTLITAYATQPVRDAVVTNMRTADAAWAAFAILDAGGDAMRWARRVLHRNEVSYDDIVALAAAVPPGSDRLLFLPYLNGERLGGAANARAQLFGLTSGHAVGHLHRAVMEGVAFASQRNLTVLERQTGRIDSIVAAGGGAKTRLWLEIKASIYDRPILVPAEPEAGVTGCAMIAAVAGGAAADWADARARFVAFAAEIAPDPQWRDRYLRLGSVFDALYQSSRSLWDRLDTLEQSEGEQPDRRAG